LSFERPAPIKSRGFTPAKYKTVPAINAVIPNSKDQIIPVLIPAVNFCPDNPNVLMPLQFIKRINNRAAICPDLVKAIMDSDEKPGIKSDIKAMAASMIKRTTTAIKRSVPEINLFNDNQTSL